jgi:hypothetical protein
LPALESAVEPRMAAADHYSTSNLPTGAGCILRHLDRTYLWTD